MIRIALIQHAPVMLDKEQTMQRAIGLIEEAVSQGAELIIFPEAYFSGYPAWIWRLRPGGDWGASDELYASLFDSAISVDAGDLQPLCEAAKLHGITLVCGMNERDSRSSSSTLYNTVIIIGVDGEIQNRHRKLMPTNPERMVWGFGDGSGLNVIDTPVGRLGTLMCWENYMPLARFALYSQGVELYIAPTYDSGDDWLGTMRHIAREGRCWVIACGVALRRSDIPRHIPELDALYPDDEEWINPGDSVVIAPRGEVTAGPMHDEQGIVYADIDVSAVASAKRDLDVVGHYARPDVFSLHVDRSEKKPSVFED